VREGDESIVFLSDVPSVGMRLKFAKRKTYPELKIDVRFRLPSGRQFEMTNSRIAKQQKFLRRKVVDTRREIAALERRLPEMQQLLKEARTPISRGAVSVEMIHAKKQAIRVLERDIPDATRLLSDLWKAKNALESEMVALDTIDRLRNRIHKKIQLQCRLYVLLDGHENDLAVPLPE